MEVSYFQTATLPCVDSGKIAVGTGKKIYHHKSQRERVDILKVFELIRDGYWKKRIEAVRAGKEKKVNLPCFTPSGVFDIRQEALLIDYSRILCVDLDSLSPFQLESIRDELKANPYVFAVFVSPSGNGLKVFFRLETDLQYHRVMFKQLAGDFEKYWRKPDYKCADPTRLCFVSYDPDLYLNEGALEVPYIQPDNIGADTNPIALIVPLELVEWMVSFTSRKAGAYIQDNRNNYLFALACNCNRYGLSLEEALSLCYQVYQQDTDDLPYQEFTRTIQSAYSYIEQHGKYQLPKSLFPEHEEEEL